jgi:L-ascorbate metabolism protein UlaG (beta-lactamase superfamily)
VDSRGGAAARVTLQALGQAGFIVRAGETVLVIDPYLSDSVAALPAPTPGLFARAFAPPLTPGQLGRPAAVLITHAHQDHCDPDTLRPLAQSSAVTRFIGPYPVAEALRSWGIPAARIERALVDRRIEIAPNCSVTPVPAAHPAFDPDSTGQPACVGYLVRTGGVTIYHAGDTIEYEGMRDRLEGEAIDIMLLPVNGRDADRERLGIVGNFQPEEAMRLASACDAKVVVPMHNDLFASNMLPRESVSAAWKRWAPGCRCEFIAAGRSLTWGPS